MNRSVLTSRIMTTVLLGLFTGCNRNQAAAPPPPEPEVVVMTVQPETITLTTELPGRTESYLLSEIRPQVNGLIQKRNFVEGSDVKAGQVLYEIDPAPFQAAWESAMASLASTRKAADRARAALGASVAGVAREQATAALSKTNYDRYENLFKDNAVSASDRDRAATDLQVAEATVHAAQAQVDSDKAAVEAADAAIKQAEAAVEAAQINLGYTKINAPISGRIGRSNVTEGATVTAYQAEPLATIRAYHPIYVDVPQSTTELTRLNRTGAKGTPELNGTKRVKIIMDDGTPYPIDGTLQFRDITVDPTTASVILRIVVPNPDGVLLPGMFVRAIIEEGVNDQAILIPQQAIARDQKGTPIALIVNSENKVQQQFLTTDRAVGDKWLVTSGLKPGDRVIVEGVQQARPGTTVKVINAPAAEVRPAAPASQPVETK